MPDMGHGGEILLAQVQLVAVQVKADVFLRSGEVALRQRRQIVHLCVGDVQRPQLPQVLHALDGIHLRAFEFHPAQLRQGEERGGVAQRGAALGGKLLQGGKHLNTVQTLDWLAVEVQLTQPGEYAEFFQIGDHARRKRRHLVRLAVVELQRRIAVPILVLPILPDVIAVEIEQRIARDAEALHPPQQSRGQGIQLVQAEKLHRAVKGLPAAVGIGHLEAVENALVYQFFRLLRHLRRHRQMPAVEAAQGREILQFVKPNQIDPDFFVG